MGVQHPLSPPFQILTPSQIKIKRKRNRIFKTKLLPAIWLDKFLMSLLILDRSSPRDLSMASLSSSMCFDFGGEIRRPLSNHQSSCHISEIASKESQYQLSTYFQPFFKGFVRMLWNMEKCKIAANRHQQGIMVLPLLNFVFVKRIVSKVFPLLQL